MLRCVSVAPRRLVRSLIGSRKSTLVWPEIPTVEVKLIVPHHVSCRVFLLGGQWLDSSHLVESEIISKKRILLFLSFLFFVAAAELVGSELPKRCLFMHCKDVPVSIKQNLLSTAMKHCFEFYGVEAEWHYARATTSTLLISVAKGQPRRAALLSADGCAGPADKKWLCRLCLPMDVAVSSDVPVDVAGPIGGQCCPTSRVGRK